MKVIDAILCGRRLLDGRRGACEPTIDRLTALEQLWRFPAQGSRPVVGAHVRKCRDRRLTGTAAFDIHLPAVADADQGRCLTRNPVHGRGISHESPPSLRHGERPTRASNCKRSSSIARSTPSDSPGKDRALRARPCLASVSLRTLCDNHNNEWAVLGSNQ